MMIRTLDELNMEFMANEPIASSTPEHDEPQLAAAVDSMNISPITAIRKNNRSLLGITSNALLFLILLIVLAAVMTTTKLALYTVTSSSMQAEIPKGSLIIVRKTDPSTLIAGDNITFMRDWKTSVTHKIVDIYEDFEGNGTRGFQTKGLSNANPDNEIVKESDVVGKVSLTIPYAGAILFYLSDNINAVLLVFGVFIIIIIMLRLVQKREPVVSKKRKS